MIQTFKSHRQWQAIFCLLLIVGLVVPFSPAAAVAGQVDANNVVTAPAIDGNLNCHGYGSSVTVTASFGFAAAGEVIQQLLQRPAEAAEKQPL